MNLVSIIIPVFNEEKNIQRLYTAITSLFLAEKELVLEYIFVNDGSRDNSLNILKQLAATDKQVKVLDFSRNFGHQAALLAGMKHAEGNLVITMDCDLQDPPELLPQMIQQWRNGFDVVYARRKNRSDGFFKKYSALLYYKVISGVSLVRIPRNVGDFRLIDKKVLDEINQMPEHNVYLRGMVAWAGFKHTFVDFNRPERTDGKTGYTLSKMVKLGMNGLMSFSFLPLRLGLFLGVLSIVSGSFLLVYQIADVLINQVYYHLYKWLVVVLFIFMGFMFMLLWIIGEYIGKIYDEVRQRPHFIINQKINF